MRPWHRMKEMQLITIYQIQGDDKSYVIYIYKEFN